MTWWRKLALLAHRGNSCILLVRGAERLVFALFVYFFGRRGVFGAISLALVLLVRIVLVIVVLLILVLLVIFFFILVFRVLIIFIIVIVGSWAVVVVWRGLGLDW